MEKSKSGNKMLGAILDVEQEEKKTKYMNKERIDVYVQSFRLKLIYDRVKAGAIWEWKLWIVRVYTCVFYES